MRARILAGVSLAAAVVAGSVAAPALAAPAKAATVCEAPVLGDEVTNHDWGTNAAALWSVECPDARHIKVNVAYVTGRSVDSEADIPAGEQWRAMDLSPSPDGSGVNGVVSVYENNDLLTQVALNWD